MPDINLLNIHKFYESNHILKGLNITIKKGDFISIIGESGSGKTTLLKIISGLISPEYGEIYFDNELSNFKDTRNRKIGYIFQDYTLYPNMAVFDNILFSLKKEKGSGKNNVDVVCNFRELLGYDSIIHTHILGQELLFKCDSEEDIKSGDDLLIEFDSILIL